MTADIGRSAMRVHRHYKKHYDDICQLFDISGLPEASSGIAIDNQLPEDLETLVATTDQKLEQLKSHIGNVDELAAIDPKQLPRRKPEFCTALVSYRNDLDRLFAAIQTIKAEAPKPKRKSKGKARTSKF